MTPAPKPRWRLRFASRILLAIALLVLQQGALTHALSHANEPAKPNGTQHCELCHAFASADAEITPPALPPLAAFGTAPASARIAAQDAPARRFVGFSSRAPPASS